VKSRVLIVLAGLTLVAALLPAASAALAPSPQGVTQMSTRFLIRPQGRIAYDDQGAGPLVILVPGIGDVRAEYRFLTPQLVAAGHRVVAMDLRGHGESSTGWDDYTTAAVGSDIVALLRELDAGPATLIGTSAGAGASVWAAAEAPSLVRNLVLIGPFVHVMPPGSMMDQAIVWTMVNVLLARPWGAQMWGSYYDSLYPAAKPADYAAYRQALTANLNERGRLEAVQAMFRDDKAAIEERLDAVTAPVLVVMGTKDPDFKDPAAEARLVAGRLKGTVLLVEGAGHYPHAEMPEQVAPAVLDFLATPAARA
jgi:pimeloyl-ACP methyl ester carboxylesterase